MQSPGTDTNTYDPPQYIYKRRLFGAGLGYRRRGSSLIRNQSLATLLLEPSQARSVSLGLAALEKPRTNFAQKARLAPSRLLEYLVPS
jgi:hypothetical protein